MSDKDEELQRAREKLNQAIREHQNTPPQAAAGQQGGSPAPKAEPPLLKQKLDLFLTKLYPYRKHLLVGAACIVVAGGLFYYLSIPRLEDVDDYAKAHNVVKLVNLYDRTLNDGGKYVAVRTAAIKALSEEYEQQKDSKGLIRLYQTCPAAEEDNLRSIVRTLVALQTVEGNNFLEDEVVENRNSAIIVDEYLARDDKFLDWKMQKFQGQLAALRADEPFTHYEQILKRMAAYQFRDPLKIDMAVTKGAIKPLLEQDKYDRTVAFLRDNVSSYVGLEPSTVRRYIEARGRLVELQRSLDSKEQDIKNLRRDITDLENRDFSYVSHKRWWVRQKIDDHEYVCEALDGYVVLQTVTVEYTTTGWIDMDVQYVGKRNGQYNIFKECNDRIENNREILLKRGKLWSLESDRRETHDRYAAVRNDINNLEYALRRYARL